MAMRKPIWRTVQIPEGTTYGQTKTFRTTLDEPCFCDNCQKLRMATFATPNPEDIAHWECLECGEMIDLEEAN